MLGIFETIAVPGRVGKQFSWKSRVFLISVLCIKFLFERTERECKAVLKQKINTTVLNHAPSASERHAPKLLTRQKCQRVLRITSFDKPKSRRTLRASNSDPPTFLTRHTQIQEFSKSDDKYSSMRSHKGPSPNYRLMQVNIAE